MPASKTCTIIGSNKGGVGKTMTALLLSLIYREAGYPLKIIEIDNAQRLSRMLNGDLNVLSIPATQNLEDISNDRFAAESHFNPVFEAWMESDSLTDLGANMTEALFSWFKYCLIDELAIDENIGFRFVCCASPDSQALRSAYEGLINAREIIGKDAELFLVLNDTRGGDGFMPYERNSDYIALMKMATTQELKVIRIPFCASKLAQPGDGDNLNPLQILNKVDEVAKAANLDRVSTVVHKKKLMKWMEDAAKALDPLLYVEERVAAGQAA
jgi:hypothetical protein